MARQLPREKKETRGWAWLGKQSLSSQITLQRPQGIDIKINLSIGYFTEFVINSKKNSGNLLISFLTLTSWCVGG